LGFAVIVSAPASIRPPWPALGLTRQDRQIQKSQTMVIFIFKQAANTAMDALRKKQTSIFGENLEMSIVLCNAHSARGKL
jgi:hypothetical protein